MRGVYSVAEWLVPLSSGSSPHARGLPTSAGHVPRARQDHPRMRGVYQEATAADGKRHGSSPHARGLLGVAGLAADGGRIIPACAGFTHGTRG